MKKSVDKKSLEYWVEREKRSERIGNIVFGVAIVLFVYFVAHTFGNRFLYATETCTVKDVRVETLVSNGGGIISYDDILYVESEECPLITFDNTPEGEGSVAEFAQKIHVGETYKFRIGLVRLFPSDWIGVGIESLQWYGFSLVGLLAEVTGDGAGVQTSVGVMVENVREDSGE